MNDTNEQMMVVDNPSTAVAPHNLAAGLSLAGAKNGSNLALANASAAEAIGMIQISKAFPRNEQESMSRIVSACGRTSLAQISSYEYVKGGTRITGPSVHLLKAIAQHWGNVKAGYRIVETSAMETKCEAYAWDMESNYYSVIPFAVRHIRYTKTGSYPLKDDREIYELIANNASRRIRKCLEDVIPNDIVQKAYEVCNETLVANVKNFDVKKMLKAFGAFDVSKEDIEAFIQRDISSLADSPGLVVRLRNIINSLKDGIAKKEDFFKANPKDNSTPVESGEDAKKPHRGKTIEQAVSESPLGGEAPKDGELSVDDVI